MFSGETAINLDAKGRLTIPVKYREVVADACNNELVLVYNPFEVSSLWLYSKKEWLTLRDAVNKLNIFVLEHRSFQMKLVGSAFHTESDKASRIQIPINMRQTASMEKKVTLLGMGNKLEIWNDAALMKSRLIVPDFSTGVTEELQNLPL